MQIMQIMQIMHITQIYAAEVSAANIWAVTMIVQHMMTILHVITPVMLWCYVIHAYIVCIEIAEKICFLLMLKTLIVWHTVM